MEIFSVNQKQYNDFKSFVKYFCESKIVYQVSLMSTRIRDLQFSFGTNCFFYSSKHFYRAQLQDMETA